VIHIYSYGPYDVRTISRDEITKIDQAERRSKGPTTATVEPAPVDGTGLCIRFGPFKADGHSQVWPNELLARTLGDLK
jgi:hypothetical protein